MTDREQALAALLAAIADADEQFIWDTDAALEPLQSQLSRKFVKIEQAADFERDWPAWTRDIYRLAIRVDRSSSAVAASQTRLSARKIGGIPRLRADEEGLCVVVYTIGVRVDRISTMWRPVSMISRAALVKWSKAVEAVTPATIVRDVMSLELEALPVPERIALLSGAEWVSTPRRIEMRADRADPFFMRVATDFIPGVPFLNMNRQPPRGLAASLDAIFQSA